MAAALWYVVTIGNKEAPARDQGQNQDDETPEINRPGEDWLVTT